MTDAQPKFDNRRMWPVLQLAAIAIIGNLVSFVTYLYAQYNLALVCDSKEAMQHQSWAKTVVIISLMLSCGMFAAAGIKLLDTHSSNEAQTKTAFGLSASLFLLLGLAAGVMTFFAFYNWLVEFPNCAA